MREADCRHGARASAGPTSRRPRRLTRARVLAWALVGTLLGACGSSDGEPVSVQHPLRVFAAASLGDLLEELAATGDSAPFEVHLAGSEVLLRQVRAGAPADLLLMARPIGPDELPPEVEPTELARTALVVAGPTAGSTVSSSADAWPTRPGDLPGHRLALADPDLAPAGAYAEQALTASGVLEDCRETSLVAAHVRDACRWVALGEADLVICYRTDVAALESLRECFAFEEVDVRYGAAVLSDPVRRQAAREWLDALRARRTLLGAHGLEVVSP